MKETFSEPAPIMEAKRFGSKIRISIQQGKSRSEVWLGREMALLLSTMIEEAAWMPENERCHVCGKWVPTPIEIHLKQHEK